MLDPVSALILSVIAAYFFIRDGGPVVTEARGLVPHTANNRHAERMQRMQHAHERWMARTAERREMRQQGGMIRQAVQRRLADWVMNAGRRVARVEDRRRVAEERDARVGRTPGRWRTAWRNARQHLAEMQRVMAQRAEQRFATRPTIFAKVVDDVAPPPAAEEAPKPMAEPGPKTAPLPPPPGQWRTAQRPAAGSADDIVDAEIVDEPAQSVTPPEPDVIDAEVVDPEPPKIPASRELEAAAPRSNVIPFHRGERMSEPTQTLVLTGGETINPEAGIAFTDGLSQIYTEIDSRIQASIANLSQAGVAQDQIAVLSELLNLNSAARGKADEMKENFTGHQNAAAVVGATGAGTHAGYLGEH